MDEVNLINCEVSLLNVLSWTVLLRLTIILGVLKQPSLQVKFLTKLIVVYC